jgi:hypothetical protein
MLESLNMKFPAPTVDIGEIRQKCHAIVQEEGMGAANTKHAAAGGRNRKKDKKGKKGK